MVVCGPSHWAPFPNSFVVFHCHAREHLIFSLHISPPMTLDPVDDDHNHTQNRCSSCSGIPKIMNTVIIHSMNCRVTSTVVLPSPPLGPGTSWTGNGRLSLTPRNAQSGPKTGADGAAGMDGGDARRSGRNAPRSRVRPGLPQMMMPKTTSSHFSI